MRFSWRSLLRGQPFEETDPRREENFVYTPFLAVGVVISAATGISALVLAVLQSPKADVALAMAAAMAAILGIAEWRLGMRARAVNQWLVASFIGAVLMASGSFGS